MCLIRLIGVPLCEKQRNRKTFNANIFVKRQTIRQTRIVRPIKPHWLGYCPINASCQDPIYQNVSVCCLDVGHGHSEDVSWNFSETSLQVFTHLLLPTSSGVGLFFPADGLRRGKLPQSSLLSTFIAVDFKPSCRRTRHRWRHRDPRDRKRNSRT